MRKKASLAPCLLGLILVSTSLSFQNAPPALKLSFQHGRRSPGKMPRVFQQNSEYALVEEEVEHSSNEIDISQFEDSTRHDESQYILAKTDVLLETLGHTKESIRSTLDKLDDVVQEFLGKSLQQEKEAILESLKSFFAQENMPNKIFLTLFALYFFLKVVFVDVEAWRGWTTSEILQTIPFANWREYENALHETPMITKTSISVSINILGDYLAQVEWGRKQDLTDFDIKRTLRNGFIALLFGPLVHYYYQFSDFILPQDEMMNGAKKILMDQSIYVSVKTFAYLSLQSLLRGQPINEAATEAGQKLLPCLIKGWSFWPFAHIITYSIIPPRHRVLWVTMLDLAWSSILASVANQNTQEPSTSQKNIEEDDKHKII